MKKILIIGYGNPLCSDDGAGQRVAEAFLEHSTLEAIATHQLTPELAEMMTQFEQVYFVDAAPIKTLQIQPLHTQIEDSTFGHFVDPQTLLKLAETLYGYVPKAYILLIPAINFTIGETLSLCTQTAVTEAIQFLNLLSQQPSHPLLTFDQFLVRETA